jgi:hypothetical protein
MAVRDGVDARLVAASAPFVGNAHTISESSARSVVVVAVDDAIDTCRKDPALRSIAHYDPLPAGQRAEVVAYDGMTVGARLAVDRGDALHINSCAREGRPSNCSS